MALSEKVKNDWVQQLKRSRNARIGGKARRKQLGYPNTTTLFSRPPSALKDESSG